MIHRKPGRDIRPKRDNFWDTYFATDGRMRFTNFCEINHCENAYDKIGFKQYRNSIVLSGKTIDKEAYEKCGDPEEMFVYSCGIFRDCHFIERMFEKVYRKSEI